MEQPTQQTIDNEHEDVKQQQNNPVINNPKPINFRREMDKALQRRGERDAGSHTELDPSTFRASSLGNCPRHILVKKLGIERADARGQGRFWLGDKIHDMIQQKILPRYMTTHEQEVTHTTGDGITLKGHYDGFDGAVVYDFKTRKSWYYYDNGHLPKKHHLDQLHVYMKALGVNHGLMVYVLKSDMKVETYPDYFGVDTSRWKSRKRKGDLDPGQLTGDEHGTLIEFDQDRFDALVDKARTVRDHLLEHGVPRSMDELDDAFPQCGSGDCMGCIFEDPDEIDFGRLPDDVDVAQG